MIPVVLIFSGFLLAILLSETVLRGAKLQSGLGRVIGVHAAALAVVTPLLITAGQVRIPALLIFWAGAFLSWFGVRSHIESSILLRMIYSLRKGPRTEKELLMEYESHYGEAQRLEELSRAGLIKRVNERVIVTSKGKSILRIVSVLK